SVGPSAVTTFTFKCPLACDRLFPALAQPLAIVRVHDGVWMRGLAPVFPDGLIERETGHVEPARVDEDAMPVNVRLEDPCRRPGQDIAAPLSASSFILRYSHSGSHLDTSVVCEHGISAICRVRPPFTGPHHPCAIPRFRQD